MGLPNWLTYAVPAALETYSERRAQRKREQLSERAMALQEEQAARDEAYRQRMEVLQQAAADRAQQEFNWQNEMVNPPVRPGEQGPLQQIPRRDREMAVQDLVLYGQQGQQDLDNAFRQQQAEREAQYRAQALALQQGQEDLQRQVALAAMRADILGGYQPPETIDRTFAAKNAVDQFGAFHPDVAQQILDFGSQGQDPYAVPNALSEAIVAARAKYPDQDIEGVLQDLVNTRLNPASAYPEAARRAIFENQTLSPYLGQWWAQRPFSPEDMQGPENAIPQLDATSEKRRELQRKILERQGRMGVLGHGSTRGNAYSGF